ncbi:hypothetical protein [Ligilactobacillus acidipiscis]|uniref:Phage protein n=1 Tax=Ligilactobacillus acidipiscis TaxID=89059 RepID=A0A0R2KFL0_9LACO|nr:hypothetical protein [Ligilactobacillus acidipiscis]KRN88177.1 hypothetical protein IV43_GL000027 [Ligilactobacillus acidipiscis]
MNETLLKLENDIHNKFSRSEEYLNRDNSLGPKVNQELEDLEQEAKNLIKTAYLKGETAGLALAIETAMKGKTYGGTE